LDKLTKFHRQQGTTLTRFPSLEGRQIDLYALKKHVDTKGGFKNVCEERKWGEIGRQMGFIGAKNISGVVTTLKNAYQRYLLPYEMYLEKAKPEFLREMGLTPSPTNDRKAPEQTNLADISRNLTEQFIKEEDTDDKMDIEQSVKVESPPPNSNGGDKKSSSPAPSQNGLKRSFDESNRSVSITSETEKENEPARRESKRIKKGRSIRSLINVAAPIVANSNMAQHAHAPRTRMSSSGSSSNKRPGENCEICGRGDNALSLLLCDGCDTGYHTFCLDPPLKAIPKYDWYCTECLVGLNEFGFEDGDEYSLAEFREKADSFRREYIKRKLRPGEADVDVSETEVEQEFWRMVSNVNETVEVEYGADVHCTTHGSGFPTIETNPTDPYSTDPWNLNIMPLDNQSLFRHIKSDVSGMTVPWLYVGMMFSTFCWHNEDHYCYSINYQHFGATKTWYGIPGSDAEKFEAAMRNAVPELFETQPDLLFQLVTMLSPGRLKDEGVKVYAVDQRPNQFIITFPQAYHAGFNHGVLLVVFH
jgi:[histone H3]-trimethyl-L-lysine4 demethylase